MRHSVYSFLILLGLAVVMSPFQNCTDARFRTAASEQQKSGNGDGYTGKVYVEFAQCGSDPRGLRAKLQVQSNIQEVDLVRENCQNIAPERINIDDLQLVPGSTREIIYRGRTFVQDEAQPVVMRLTPSCDDGSCLNILGTGLCNSDQVVEVAPVGGQPFSANCRVDGGEVNVNLPRELLSADAPLASALSLTLRNSSPEGRNSADFMLNLSPFGQPVIHSVTSCGTNCLRIQGLYFGICSVQLFDAAGEKGSQVTQCHPDNIYLNLSSTQTAGGTMMNSPAPLTVQVFNGIKSTSASYSPVP